MVITIDHLTLIINIPKVDTQLVDAGPPEIRQLNLDSFRLTLKDIEDDEEGITLLDTHNHNPPVTVGGVTLARVVEIINGYTITFEDGQYAVNLVGANSNVSDVTNVNQVSVRSANSAGLTFSLQIENTAFQDARVWIDTVEGTSGTKYPRGTVSDPVSNLADAQSIIANRGLPKRLRIKGALTFGASNNIDDYDILGFSHAGTPLIFVAGCSTVNTVIEKVRITGTLSGATYLRDCMLHSGTTGVDAHVIDSSIRGTIIFTDNMVAHNFMKCHSSQVGTATPIIDFNSLTSISAQFRQYSGGLEIQNFIDAGNQLSIDLVSGRVVLDSTCTAGTIVVRGIGELVDNSGAGCTVVRTGLLDTPENIIAQKILRNKFITDPDTGKATVFDDDGTTVLVEGDLFEDAAGTQSYQGKGAERRERLT